MEKINVAELLKDSPSGTELNCTMYDNLYFDSLNADYCGTINCYTLIDGIKTSITFTKYGTFNNHTGAKCVIFPKGKTTWEGFQRPFKDGDILTYTSNHTTTFIYRNKDNEPNFSTSFYVACNNAPSNNFLIYNKYTLSALNENCDVRLATEKEKAQLFQAIKVNGYKWNEETKTLEKLIEPKFKVGDIIQSKNSIEQKRTIKKCKDDGYWTTIDTWIVISDQDDWELVPNKFNITTLKPFDKVLVRDGDKQEWCISFFDRCNGLEIYKYSCINGVRYSQCIPYEGNQHLLGKTDDCDEFYKTWK